MKTDENHICYGDYLGANKTFLKLRVENTIPMIISSGHLLSKSILVEPSDENIKH